MPERLWGPGYRGAVSLTFDDGLACQAYNALPELDSRNIKATFFLIVNQAFGPSAGAKWYGALLNGHELGSHSMNHKKAATLSYPEALSEAGDSQLCLASTFQTEIQSFCYPYTDAIDTVATAARRYYKQARGGRVARVDKFIPFGDGVNLHNVPCFHVGPKTIMDAPLWIEEAVRRRAWFTLMLHGVGEQGAWDNISIEVFAQLLDALQAADLWIAPFGTVAEFFRGAR